MFLLKKFTIKGESMSPTINPGDVILASFLPYFLSKPKINELVIVLDPRNGKILVKRITKIDKSKYYVSGDNPIHSTDSRVFGFIKRSDIIGRVIYIKNQIAKVRT